MTPKSVKLKIQEKNVTTSFGLNMTLFQENMNKMVSEQYSERTRRAMAQMSEKEMNFDLIEVIICLCSRFAVNSLGA